MTDPTSSTTPSDPMTTTPEALGQPEAVAQPEAAAKAKTAKESALEALYAAAGLAEVAANQVKTRLNRSQVQATTTQAKARLAELQRQLETYRTEAGQTYAQLATRGKITVDQTLVTAKHLSGINERKGARASGSTGPASGAAQEVIVVKDGDAVEEVIVVNKTEPTETA
ncbi:MAG TPA: hypothetical protein VF635_11905 [Propionibacteriaceae bacterium]|jgi:cell shape-determining protein MreC